MGYVFTARSVGYLFGSMLGGPLFDRFDGNKLLAVALVLTIVGTALIPVVSDIWLLAALVTLIGFACVPLPSTSLIDYLTHARTAGWASSTREATSASSDFTATTSGRTFKVAYPFSNPTFALVFLPRVCMSCAPGRTQQCTLASA
jgi:MFS family permease